MLGEELHMSGPCLKEILSGGLVTGAPSTFGKIIGSLVLLLLLIFGDSFLDEELLTKKVADYVTPEGDWDFLKLSQVLDEEYMQLFLPIKPLEDNLGEDYIA